MKSLLRKFHIIPNQSEDIEGPSNSSKNNRLSDASSNERLSSESQSYHHNSEHKKPFSAISGWLNSVTNRRSPSPPSSSSATRIEHSDSVSSSVLDAALDAVLCNAESSNSRDPEVAEEYQIQLALELSAREDPEAVQIEAIKQISLGSSQPENTPAEVVAYRYWNYNALSYDDKILDGFYDLYGILVDSNMSNMPSLVDLQVTPVSDNVSWEAILVNKVTDSKLVHLIQKALEIAAELRPGSFNSFGSDLVQKLAALVSDHMGGPVGDPDNMLVEWRTHSYSLKETLGSMVLPIGSLTIGLARHRALLFKVLADSIGIPCRLVKGQQYTGFDDVAMNFVRIQDAREYIVDLMADPGTLIPSDAAGSHIDYQNLFFSNTPLAVKSSSSIVSSSSGASKSFVERTLENISRSSNVNAAGNKPGGRSELMPLTNLLLHSKFEEVSKKSSARSPKNVWKDTDWEILSRSNPSDKLLRSPSWTEGLSSPAACKMKVKDVSQYMIDAAKENPQLAQKLHDVLLESGVVAPPNLFTEVYQEQLNAATAEPKSPSEDEERNRKRDNTLRVKGQGDPVQALFLPPLRYHGAYSKGGHDNGQSVVTSDSTEVGDRILSSPDLAPAKYVRNVPVAAAAAAAAAVVASSMVVAAAKTNADSNLELPVAAAATATAAAVVATTAAVGRQYENAYSPGAAAAAFFNQLDLARSDGDPIYDPMGSGDQALDATLGNLDGERRSDRSTGNDSTKSDTSLEEVADCEIPWKDITLGERIGLGSYGEVYRGDWHGTEVAVKKFLDQDIIGESLEEFKSEVLIMKKVRHPNVVLFMGAITRVPNLSIVTEFLPRGSLYRLLHRQRNQLDVRKRLKMALDTARGMNYLHNCTPVIVHRDLKSPNLLVDKNWVVKVCDFGLSRLKHSTFLSSRSTAGTAEWMAPEVLRNEPSDEKCDVFSYGVILWELCTLQQPWGGMNPMQVVGAVGFQHRRLDIPDDMDPVVADIITKCWQTDPRLRPTFAEIMAALKPLQKPITTSQVPRPPISAGSWPYKGQSSQTLEE